jgi:D-apionate oxidoisomerase
MTTIALMGAGGKMGVRLTQNLMGTRYSVRHVEISEVGRKRLAEIGVETVATEEALAGADAVVLAVPDNLIGKVAHDLAPQLRPGTMLIVLDAAAPHAGDMPKRDDLIYFVTHPCHPPLYNDETDPEAKRDFFGGVKAKQHIVCALMQGPEEAYATGEAIAREIFKPVMRSHRITVEQMAILEPVLSETVGATCVTLLREATDEAIRRGVPKEAAVDFMLGHLNIEIAILFEQFPGGVFSDGAKKAIEKAKAKLFQPDWKRVFEPDEVMASVRMITRPEKG